MKKIVAVLMAMVMVMSVTVALAGGVAATKETQSEKTPVIIMFKDQTDKDLIKQHGGEIKSVYQIKPAVAASLPQKAIDGLKKHPKIAFIVPDLEIFIMAETLDWGVDRIDADIVHEYNNGTGVKVAIMDTGIDYNHPDLADNYEGGYDFGGEYSGAPNDDDPMDYNGHGTHCAGIVAAVKGNEIGVIGVAPEADLYAVKVFSDDGYGNYSDVIEGLEWCINNDIQVISMSFGSSYSAGNPGIELWINDAYDAGILLVGAAGNDGNWFGVGDNVIYPARYDNVIAVAATDSRDGRAYWSSTGPDVELASPGVNIYSTILGGRYGTKSGTSMACPMVSGAAALVIASNSSLTNADVRVRLQETADDIGATGRDTKYGYGLVDADEAAPPTANQPPVADAGADQTVSDADGNGVEAVTLDGSGSSDPDGSIDSYEWKEDGTSLSSAMSFTRDFSVGMHTVTLTVTDNDGATDNDTAIVNVSVSGHIDDVTNADIPVKGSVSGSYLDTHVSDNVCEAIEERESGGKPANRYRYLEHKWTIDVTGGTDATFYVEAYHTANGEGDDFVFEYSKDDSTYIPLVTVTKTADDNAYQTYTFTEPISGTVYIRVRDTDRTAGKKVLDTISIDHMYIQSVSAPPGDKMHISDIDMTLKTAGPNTNAIAVVTIVDANGIAVGGATVSGHWGGATSDTDSGTTDASGQVSLNSDKRKNPPSGTNFTFTVDNVIKDGWTYDPYVGETSDSITVP